MGRRVVQVVGTTGIQVATWLRNSKEACVTITEGGQKEDEDSDMVRSQILQNSVEHCSV